MNLFLQISIFFAALAAASAGGPGEVKIFKLKTQKINKNFSLACDPLLVFLLRSDNTSGPYLSGGNCVDLDNEVADIVGGIAFNPNECTAYSQFGCQGQSQRLSLPPPPGEPFEFNAKSFKCLC